MTNLKKKLFFIGLAVLAAVIVFFFIGLLQERQEKREQAFYDALQRGRELAGKENPQSIAEFEKALGLTWDKNTEASVKLELGVAYHQFENLTKAVLVLKEIVQDNTYRNTERAYATNAIVAIYFGNGDRDFAEQYIFTNEEPWRSFKEGVTMEEAARKAYEWSNNLFSTSDASRHIALWYGDKLITEKLFLPQSLAPEDRSAYLDKFSSHLEMGDALFASEIQAYLPYPYSYASSLHVQGLLQAMDYVINNDLESKQKVETSYTTALKVLDNKTTKSYRSATLLIQYHYAIWLSLLASQGEDHKEAIKPLVTAIIEEENKTLPFFTVLSLSKNQGVALQYATLVAKVDPRFGDFLRDLGWEI